jgi:hypothetical protein
MTNLARRCGVLLALVATTGVVDVQTAGAEEPESLSVIIMQNPAERFRHPGATLPLGYGCQSTTSAPDTPR